jgi:lysophospholipase L1-like esterase
MTHSKNSSMKGLFVALTAAWLFAACKHEIVASPSRTLVNNRSNNSFSSLLPANIPNLAGWWDLTDTASLVLGTGGRVSGLKDRSGNGHDMIYGVSFPVFHASGGANGLPYMSITNGQEIYSGSISLPQPYTIYYVMRNDAFTNGGFVLAMDNGNVSFIQQSLEPAGKALTMHAGSSFNRNTNNYHEGTWQLLTLGVDNPNARMQTNNEPYILPEYSFNDNNPGAAPGSLIGFSPYYMNSSYSVEELLVYDGQPTTADDSLIRDYLVKKYAIPKNKVAVFFGDSITWGAAATDPDSSSYAADIVKDKGWQIVNWGFPGSVAVSTPGAPGVTGRNGEDLYQFALAEGADLSNSYLFFAYGTNDVSTDSNWVNKYITMINAYIDRGVAKDHITICTMPARAAGGITSLTPVYTLTYDNTKKVVAATGVNFYDNITYESATWTPSNMAQDGIHLTDLGMRNYANGLEKLLPSE